MIAVVGLACSTTDSDGAVVCDPPPEPDPRFFVDRAGELGVTFTHHMQGDLCHISDTVGGPGVCAFDYDGDGAIDLYFPDRAGHPSALYRNEGDRFAEVAAQVGVDAPGDGIGCLAFDYDADDDLDLFVSTIGPDKLYRNDGGTFADVSAEAGVEDAGFSTSATAGDIDGDGDLDLFVGRLVKLETCPDECYLFPLACESEVSLLYVNQGDGTFTESASSRGVAAAEPTLASLLFDQDLDGDLDLYVGNDMGVAFADRLYVNDGTGTFTDRASELGYSAAGTDTMGVAVGDVNGDGVTDMVTTDFKDRPTRYYECPSAAGPCSFRSLPPESATAVHWAIGLFDADNDGDLDVFQTGGDVFDPERVGSLNQLFLNDGGFLSYFEPTADSGLSKLAVHRGAAFADLDADGDVDVAVAVNGGTPELLYNVGARGHGGTLRLGTQEVGALVSASLSGRWSSPQHAVIGGGYLGSSEPGVHLGLGDECQAQVRITRLDGTSREELAQAR